MNYQPNLSYSGQYYFNPQWAPVVEGDNEKALIYNNVVNFTVAPDGTHYFHQMYRGQFIPPAFPTTFPKTNVAPPTYDKVVNMSQPKTTAVQRTRHSEHNKRKTAGPTYVVRRKGSPVKTTAKEEEKKEENTEDEEKDEQEEQEDNDEEEEEEKDTSDEDVWATEDEETAVSSSDSSQEEFNEKRLRVHARDRRRRPYKENEPRPKSPAPREVDARSTIVSLVPREFHDWQF